MAAHKFTERKDTSTRTDADPGVAESWGATGPRFGRVAGEQALVTCPRETAGVGTFSAGMFVMIGPTLVQHQHLSVNTIPIRYQCILAAHRQLDTIIPHNLSDA